MPTWFLLLCQFSIIATAMVAGVFLAFSDFLMRALDTTGTAAGIETMQAINREVMRTIFMALLIGMAPVSVIIGGYAYVHISGTTALLLMLAAGVYLIGVFGVTIGFNVPLNNLLAAADPASSAGADLWKTRYLSNWTFWNSVRTAGSALSAGLILYALTGQTQG